MNNEEDELRNQLCSWVRDLDCGRITKDTFRKRLYAAGFAKIPEEIERLLNVFEHSGNLCLGHFVRAYDKHLETKKLLHEEDLTKTYTSTFALALRSASLIEIFRFYKRLNSRAIKMDGGISFEDFLQAANIMENVTEKDCFNIFVAMSARQYNRISLSFVLSKLIGSYSKMENALVDIFTRACSQQIDKKSIYRSIPMTIHNVSIEILSDLDHIIKENYKEAVPEAEFKDFLLCLRYSMKNANFYLFLNTWKDNLLNDKNIEKEEKQEEWHDGNNAEERETVIETKAVIPPYYIHEETTGTKILHMKIHPRTASIAEAHRRGNGNIITWSGLNR